MNSNKVIQKHKRDGLVGDRLSHLHDVPAHLYFRGVDPNEIVSGPTLAIVGSRKMTTYGRAVTEKLATELARAGVVIISGLALGVDSAAHRMATEANIPTIAVLAAGLDTIHPTTHLGLANTILEQGGALVSEYSEGTPPLPHRFLERNRIIAALADGVLVTEAAIRSGSLNTAGVALELGKPVFAVPGPITSNLSEGTNQLIKTGAIPVTSVEDILDVLGVNKKAVQQDLFGANPQETAILTALASGVCDGTALQEASELDSATFAQTLTMLEINGRIKALGGNTWALK